MHCLLTEGCSTSILCKHTYTLTVESAMFYFAASLFVEAAVVGIVCIVFLILFIVAGVKQILNDDTRD